MWSKGNISSLWARCGCSFPTLPLARERSRTDPELLSLPPPESFFRVSMNPLTFFFFFNFLVTLWTLSQKSQDSRWNTLYPVLSGVNGPSHELDTGVRSVIIPVTWQLLFCHHCCFFYFTIFSSSNSTAFIEIYISGRYIKLKLN